MAEKYKITGIIRSEKFGGIYYERDRLVIEMLNKVGYEIIRMIGSGYSNDEIIHMLYNTYDVDYETLKNDVSTYINYLYKSKYIVPENKILNDKTDMNHYNSSVMINNNFKNRDFILGMEPFELKAPLKVLLELTYSCNLKCIHCFADAEFCSKNKFINEELNYNDWCKIIDNIIKNEVFEILLSGGEATMRSDLIKICEYIHSKGRGYSLLTNATLIDRNMAHELKRTGCAKVESNLDGYNAETYEAFRGVKGSFEKTISGIKACLDSGLQVRCNVMETKLTIFNLKEIVDLAYKIGVREVCVIPLEMGGRAKNIKNICFEKNDMENLNKFYEETTRWFEDKYKNTDMILFTPNQFSRGESKYSKIFDIENIMPRCGAGLIHCTINPFGVVKMCPTDHSLLVKENNNVLKKDLGYIWKNSEVLNKVRSKHFKKCVHCEKECGMECPVIRYEDKKDLLYDCKVGG
ncbi:PqqD family peptide modification chaperone [Anaerococcus sp.]|uniref:radical SAM protein n=1 Tax=Anaerococcus sp. TaxID=1872515 RepID=UPI001D1C85D7|nr:PqqD family peptide modification chaperone [Anaerococcus sp.]MBS6025789.1 PqqD family peptide modification chaperone [Paeniclostridium sordellii]MBS6106902.1 PqqD family peptide modification chaperone [Anaerococcus sp.]